MNKKMVDQKVERIIRWRESLATMPDERFFELIRIYLGEIHTPFNKDRLIEQLSALFRKEQTKKTIASFLSEFDIKIISAVSILPEATQEKISEFFSDDYPLSEIYSEIQNLAERLLMYSYKDSTSQTAFLALNPLLEETLSPFIGIKHLFPQPKTITPNSDAMFALTPLFIASFISYLESYPQLCRNDLSIRKKDAERLEELFPGREKCLGLLLKAFINLGIFHIGEKGLSADKKYLEHFAALSELRQYAYLAVASAARFGRENLKSQAQLLIDIAASIPKTGFSRASLVKAAFLLNSTEQYPAMGTFSRLIEMHTKSFSDRKTALSGVAGSIIDSAVEFGIFKPCGTDENETNLFIPNAAIQSDETVSEVSKRGLLNINAGTSITIMPGLSLAELLPFISFMDIARCSTVTEFEITKKSISRAFDENRTPEELYKILSLYSAYDIPQSLKINIDDWYNSYSSALLYKGYVLSVNEKTARIVENNPKIMQYFQKKLSDGIYLLNIPLDESPERFIKRSGLEFMGTVRSAKTEETALHFPVLRDGKNFLSEKTSEKLEKNEPPLNADEIKRNFYQKLDGLKLTEQQRECLSSRIERNIIVTEEQLRADTVRLEFLEMDGMNYAGKLRLIEKAIDSGNAIEITVSADNDSSRLLVYVGKPLMLSKHTNDAMVRMQLEPDKEVRFFSVSKANKVKIIKTSVFS